MASTTTLRSRRSAAQLHALEQVEREIRATDPHLRRKYLRAFQSAYQNYESLLTRDKVVSLCEQAEVVLVGDYHALPASQQFAAELVRELRQRGRKVVLGLEFVFARDQHILDEWLRGEIDDDDLRERIRFDTDWGYEWPPFHALLESGREWAECVYGLDCLPRNNLRKIGRRDQHAAMMVDDIRKRHPEAIVIVVIGESHLAPNHLPRVVRQSRSADRILTVLQNVDALYWKAAGEPCENVDAVQISDNALCVFNSSPLEKYESYRLCIDRWRQERTTAPDLAPAFYNMVDALLRFLNIDGYSPTTGTQPGFLLDRLPEVHCRFSEEKLRRLVLRYGGSEGEFKNVLTRIQENGVCYSPRVNAVFARDFKVVTGAEEATRFVHAACRAGRPNDNALALRGDEDRFYACVLEQALAYFGSRALYPARAPVRESDLYPLYAQWHQAGDDARLNQQAMKAIDFLVLHKDYEANCRYYRHRPGLIDEGVRWTDDRAGFVTRWLGEMLGSQIYEAYVNGRIPKRFVRSLFRRNLDKPGLPRTTYFVTARRLHKARKRQW